MLTLLLFGIAKSKFLFKFNLKAFRFIIHSVLKATEFYHYLNMSIHNCRLTKLKECTVPTQVNSASLHPNNEIFVCAGEDLKVYKFDFTTGVEIGMFLLSFLHFLNHKNTY